MAEQEVLRQQYQLKEAVKAGPTAAQLLEQEEQEQLQRQQQDQLEQEQLLWQQLEQQAQEQLQRQQLEQQAQEQLQGQQLEQQAQEQLRRHQICLQEREKPKEQQLDLQEHQRMPKQQLECQDQDKMQRQQVEQEQENIVKETQLEQQDQLQHYENPKQFEQNKEAPLKIASVENSVHRFQVDQVVVACKEECLKKPSRALAKRSLTSSLSLVCQPLPSASVTSQSSAAAEFAAVSSLSVALTAASACDEACADIPKMPYKP